MRSLKNLELTGLLLKILLKLFPGQQWIYLPRTSVDDIAIVPIGVLLTVRYLFRAW